MVGDVVYWVEYRIVNLMNVFFKFVGIKGIYFVENGISDINSF